MQPLRRTKRNEENRLFGLARLADWSSRLLVPRIRANCSPGALSEQLGQLGDWGGSVGSSQLDYASPPSFRTNPCQPALGRSNQAELRQVVSNAPTGPPPAHRSCSLLSLLSISSPGIHNKKTPQFLSLPFLSSYARLAKSTFHSDKTETYASSPRHHHRRPKQNY